MKNAICQKNETIQKLATHSTIQPGLVLQYSSTFGFLSHDQTGT